MRSECENGGVDSGFAGWYVFYILFKTSEQRFPISRFRHDLSAQANQSIPRIVKANIGEADGGSGCDSLVNIYFEWLALCFDLSFVQVGLRD